MSVEALTWCLDQEAGGPGAKLVLMCLANYADRDGVCWPSQELISRQTEQSERTVRRHLETLEARNLLHRTKRRDQDGGFMSDVFQLDLAQRTIWPAVKMTVGQNRPQPAVKMTGKPSEENQEPSTARARVVPLHPDGELIPCPERLEPTTETREFVRIHAGVKEIDPLQVAEFTAHHHGTGLQLTAEAWQGRLRKWLVREKRYQQAQPARKPARGASGTHAVARTDFSRERDDGRL